MKSAYQKLKKRLFKNSKYQSWLFLYVGSILVCLSFLFANFSWLIVPGMVLILFYIERLKRLSLKRCVIDFYLAELIMVGSSFLYFFQSATQNWDTVVSGWFVFGSRFVTWLIATIFCALPFIGFGLVLYKIKDDTRRLWLALLLWPIFEIVRALAFSVISYGGGGKVGFDVSFGSLAVSASGTPLVFISRIFGFWGLSFAVMALSLGCLFVLKRRFVVGASLIFVVMLISVIGFKLGAQKDTARHKIAIVHLNEKDAMSQWQNFDSIPNYIDLLVLPEYSEATNEKVVKQIASKLSDNGVAVTTESEGKLLDVHNRLVYFNDQGEIISSQNKTRLTPMGEYLPWVIEQAFKLFKQKKLLDTFMYVQMVKKGDEPIKTVNYKGVTYGALPCSGVLAINDYNDFKNHGAKVLVNSASLSFISPNSFFHTFGKNMARFQAVRSGLPMLQASRSGQSYIYDAQGKLLTHNQNQQSSVMTYDIYY